MFSARLPTLLAIRRSRSASRARLRPSASPALPKDFRRHAGSVAAALGRRDSTPPDVQSTFIKLVELSKVAPGARALVLGSGALLLLPHLQAAGVVDLLVVSPAVAELDEVRSRHADPGPLGNTPGVRCWCGDVASLPVYYGPCAAAYVVESMGQVAVGAPLLTALALRLVAGGAVALCYPLGRSAIIDAVASGSWRLACGAEPTVPPAGAALAAAAAGTSLVLEYEADPRAPSYAAVLRVPTGYALPGGPLRWAASVVRGFGRGSKQLGVPTANLDPACIPGLESMARGVYFGWAVLPADGPWTPARKMVLNVGVRPTFAAANPGEADATVEVHFMDAVGRDFYGEPVRAVVSGYLRPELTFGSLGDLIARIRADVGASRSALDGPPHAALRGDLFLTGAADTVGTVGLM